MKKDDELYYEEQRQCLLNIKKSIDDLASVFTNKIAIEVKPADKIKVDGEVSVSNSLEIDNLYEIKNWLTDLGETIKFVIENNSYKPVSKISIENIEQAKTSELKINNLDDLKKYFKLIESAIVKNQPILNIEKQQIKFPTLAKDAIPVRLSDGKAFYKAIMSSISGGFNTSGLATSDKQNEIITAIGTIGGNATALYTYVQKDTSGATYKYYGYMKSDGGWYIKRITISTNLAEFAVGTTDYTTNWTGRSGLSYTAYSNAF